MIEGFAGFTFSGSQVLRFWVLGSSFLGSGIRCALRAGRGLKASNGSEAWMAPRRRIAARSAGATKTVHLARLQVSRSDSEMPSRQRTFNTAEDSDASSRRICAVSRVFAHASQRNSKMRYDGGGACGYLSRQPFDRMWRLAKRGLAANTGDDVLKVTREEAVSRGSRKSEEQTTRQEPLQRTENPRTPGRAPGENPEPGA